MPLKVKDGDGLDVNLQSVTVSAEQVVSHANPGGYVVDETGTLRTVQRANVALEASGELIAAPGANLAIRVLALMLAADGETVGRLEADDGDTSQEDVFGSASAGFAFAEGGGFVLQRNDHGWFQLPANHALNLELSVAADVVGSIVYVVVDDA